MTFYRFHYEDGRVWDKKSIMGDDSGAFAVVMMKSPAIPKIVKVEIYDDSVGPESLPSREV